MIVTCHTPCPSIELSLPLILHFIYKVLPSSHSNWFLVLSFTEIVWHHPMLHLVSFPFSCIMLIHSWNPASAPSSSAQQLIYYYWNNSNRPTHLYNQKEYPQTLQCSCAYYHLLPIALQSRVSAPSANSKVLCFFNQTYFSIILVNSYHKLITYILPDSFFAFHYFHSSLI